MNSSKTAIVVSQIIEKLQLMIGIFIIIIFGLAAIICTFDGETDAGAVIAMYVCAAVGVLLIVLSRKRKKLIKNFKIYVIRLSTDPTGSIDNLAIGLGTSPDVVKKNIQKMIDKKYFVNAYIDTNANRIVFPMSSNMKSGSKQEFQNPTPQTNVEYDSITCKNCGGLNKTIKGNVYECDFCGSPLK